MVFLSLSPSSLIGFPQFLNTIASLFNCIFPPTSLEAWYTTIVARRVVLWQDFTHRNTIT